MPSNISSKYKHCGINLVLGSGGARGAGHIGVLFALEKQKVKIGMVTGVSIGALIGSFLANGYSPEAISMIIIHELEELNNPKSYLADLLQWPSWKDFWKGRQIDILPALEHIVEKYGLKPQKHLQIVAYHANRRRPVIFSGLDYNLPKAIAASCAVPMVMKAIPHCNDCDSQPKDNVQKWFDIWLKLIKSFFDNSDHGLLIDGFLHHPIPVEFSEKPVIISNLGFASKLPGKWLKVGDFIFHLLEMFASRFLNGLFAHPDPKDHLVIQSGAPHVATLTFSIKPEQYRTMILVAYAEAMDVLRKAKASGFVPKEHYLP